jgi:type VI protein secretion system component VasF
MRTATKLLITTLVAFATALGTAPAALAASTVLAKKREHPSSDLPWAIGLGVVAVLALAFLLMSLRRGMSRRRESGPFRES